MEKGTKSVGEDIMTDTDILGIVCIIIYVVAAVICIKKAYEKSPIRFETDSDGTPEKIRENVIDKVYSRCKELASSGEVTYFTLSDIRTIIDEIRKEESE